MNLTIKSLLFIFLILNIKTIQQKSKIANKIFEYATNKQNHYEYKLYFFKVSNKWGFDILKNNKLYIHQPTIPAISGNVSFRTKKDAKLVGELMIKKITKGIFPPSVTIYELDSLKIRYDNDN